MEELIQNGVGDQGSSLLPPKQHPKISLLPQDQQGLVNALQGNKTVIFGIIFLQGRNYMHLF